VRPSLSLRSRVLLGAILWTLGLLIIASVAVTVAVTLHPRAAYAYHSPFRYGRSALVVAAVCMVAGLWHVRKGLVPVHQLRARLSGVRDGRSPRVEGRYPAEVQPLVDDLNSLLEQRERAVDRAVAKAGDLAHGLKTPLTILAQEADRIAASGHHDLATTISQQVERMRRQVDYHLAHARAAASGAAPGARSVIGESAEGLVRTMLRVHADRGVAIHLAITADHAVRAEREDLDEMLGNLLDNACKWAASRVDVSSCSNDSAVAIIVDDDGPGVDAGMRDAVLKRGVRADEAAPGSGLGLAIVRDLAELYGGSISLETSSRGGLRARLQLPSA
jgi:signal transduction histidine kinase